MGIQHFKGSQHSPEGEGSIKIGDTCTTTSFDRQLQLGAGSHRLLPAVYVVEKGKPYTYTALGPSALYIIEGEFTMEDQSTPAPPILLTKGDVAVTSEGTIVKCSSPSKTRAFCVTYVEASTVVTDGLEV